MIWLSFYFVVQLVNAAVPGDPTCAKNSTVLRKGPGAQFAVSWRVPRYMPFLRFENKGAWVKVQDFEGETHWAAGKDLSKAIHCVVVKSQVATLRKEPRPTGKLADLRTLDRYTPLKKLDNEGEWIHVEDDAGHQAWINESSVWKPIRVTKFDF